MAMRPSLPVPTLSRRAKIIIGVVVLLVLVLSVLGSLVRLYVDWLWFGEVDYRQVFNTGLRTRILLFVVFGLLMAAVIAANLLVAYRFRPPFRPMSLEQQNLERYRSALEPRRKLIVVLVSGVLGVFTGITAQAQWQTWLLWRNGTRFGVQDPQFGMDIAYYTFTYPFQRFVLGLLFTAVVLSLLSALAVHYLFGGVRLQTPGEKVTPAARVHLSVLLGIFVLLKAAAYYLDRYGLLFNERDGRTGASYTDVNAVLPAKTILMFVALICAVAVLANIFLRNVQLPAIALVLLVLTSVLASGIYPAIVQQFTVRPNANEKEAEYIGRNIQATRAAYGIKSVQEGGKVNQQPYNATTDVAAALPKLRADRDTIPNARLLDPNILTPTFRQLQQISNVYDFPNKLDIDRYTIGGKESDFVVAVRELKSDNLTGNQTNWINRHTLYTHGNGFVAAAANEDLRTAGDFEVRDLPTSGPIKVDQPRIYYGELISDYSIVGTTGSGEFDRPGSGGEDVRFAYDGDGGVNVGNLANRLAFAAYYRERNILLSGAIDGDSKILFVRDPADRVEKVAPFLKVDGDPYPAVIGGRIVWIIDGYTTLNNYPYSERQTLGEVAADSRTGQGTRALPRQDVNYIRNSVKATVDAYTGKVSLYEFDENDPVLKTWMKVYPDVIQPAERDHRRAARAPALPGGPLQGPAGAAHPLPRHRPAAVLQQPELLAGAAGPDDRAGRRPAAVLHRGPGAGAGACLLPAHQRAERAVPGKPGGVRDGVQRPRRLRRDAGPGAAQQPGGARAGAGTGPVPVDPGDRPGDLAARPARVRGQVRQPAHPAGRRRPALRRAAVRAGPGAAVPDAAVRAGRLRQPDGVRADLVRLPGQALRCGSRRGGTGRGRDTDDATPHRVTTDGQPDHAAPDRLGRSGRHPVAGVERRAQPARHRVQRAAGGVQER